MDCCILKSRLERVQIEKRVFPVVDCNCLRSVGALEPHVSHSRHVKVDVFPLDLNALELAIVELGSVTYVFDIGRGRLVACDDASEVLFGEGRALRGLEPFFDWQVCTFDVLAVDGLRCRPSVAMSENVLGLYAWDETAVAWDVLGLRVGSWSSNPVLTML